MSIAKQLIGEPAPKPAVSNTESIEAKPVHAMDLIDALAEQEFGAPILDAKKTGLKQPAEGGTPAKAMKQGKKSQGKLATGKTTPGQVAAGPSGVRYGKK